MAIPDHIFARQPFHDEHITIVRFVIIEPHEEIVEPIVTFNFPASERAIVMGDVGAGIAPEYFGYFGIGQGHHQIIGTLGKMIRVSFCHAVKLRKSALFASGYTVVTRRSV